MATWLINDVTLATLGLANPKPAYTSMQADVFTVDHLTAAWDADPIFAYGQQIVVKKDGVTVFVGKVRSAPCFAGPNAESTSYEILGPWDWLARRKLVQNQAVYPDTGVGPPTMAPQGLIILNQDDEGNTVTVAQALETIINQAIAVGVPILLGDILGFDYKVAWDEIADLTFSDAITRLLATATDVVVHWDYTTVNGLGNPAPTIHIVRSADLEQVTLAIAPANTPVSAFEAGTYAAFETVRAVKREDLMSAGVFLTYRRVNTVDGNNYLQLVQRNAGTGEPTDENAVVHTIQLAGSSARTVAQPCVTALIPVSIGTETLNEGDAGFEDALKFLGRCEAWLLDHALKVTKLKPIGAFSSFYRRALEPNPATGAMEEVPAEEVDYSLTRELVDGNVAPWMITGGLNRKVQEQEVCYEITCEIRLGGGPTPYNGSIVKRAFTATNASNRTYSYLEADGSGTPEETPEGLEDALLADATLPRYDLTFTLKERDCALAIRPGKAINLSGGRAEWLTMKAIVQSASADPTTGTTNVTCGWPKQLTPDVLQSRYRLNRIKRQANLGLTRTTGIF